MSTEVATTGSRALTRPAFIKEGMQGHENITADDIKLPALKLAQGTSPEIKRANARFIDGLREGEFFNALTKDIYGEDPIGVIIVNVLGHRHVEFDKDGKVVEFNVPDRDPRTEWTDKVIDGKKTRCKPIATKFYDYLALVVLPTKERKLMTFSLKSTQLKKAVEINSIVAEGKLPCYAYQFNVTPAIENGAGNKSWYGWVVRQGWPEEQDYFNAEKLYDKFCKTKIDLAVDEEGEAEGANVVGAPINDDDIPF